jgi:hypothetical protein
MGVKNNNSSQHDMKDNVIKGGTQVMNLLIMFKEQALWCHRCKAWPHVYNNILQIIITQKNRQHVCWYGSYAWISWLISRMWKWEPR